MSGRPMAVMLASAAALVGCVPAPATAPLTAPPAPMTAARDEPAPRLTLPPPPELVSPVLLGLPPAIAQGGVALGTAPVGTTRLTLDGAPVVLASDGRFLIAADRDATGTLTLTAALTGARTLTATLPVTPRAWRLERLDRVAKVPVPDADFARRRPAELRQIAAARAVGANSDGWRQRFHWPVTGRISGLFGAQRIYRGQPGSYHGGVDVARGEGTPVVAPADGVVTLVADPPFTLEGRLLILDHGAGLTSAFLHLSRIDVRVGQQVRQGEPIGLVGRTGRASGPHLHWAMTWRGVRIDPQPVAGAMPAG
ncbi:M23 family metallopeptidase [Sphingomonas sp. BK345]|uniref:M23 family metallopeptidase n=1 Tax=Sphingomonas sp. BK345 TaxID=2586980 RepID=UPI0018066113|nr:M23 family metallopeptidase [Sphingomonas sp. BK345]MBB3471966.1 murein DD-endopeptidase MepM/ murein hydrolase activator NlpD [Sphingomonas sp. BK345]